MKGLLMTVKTPLPGGPVAPKDKHAATNAAAWAIIDADTSARRSKMERLKAMRLEQEAAEAKAAKAAAKAEKAAATRARAKKAVKA
jgi:hypothetical protein